MKILKCWICDNDYVDYDIKVRDHCHITGKYRGSVQRHCNTNLKFTQSLKNDSYLILKELGKFNLKFYAKQIRKMYDLYYH